MEVVLARTPAPKTTKKPAKKAAAKSAGKAAPKTAAKKKASGKKAAAKPAAAKKAAAKKATGKKAVAKKATGKKAVAKRLSALGAARFIAATLDAMKAVDIRLLDVGAVSPIAEYFLLASGDNARHVSALTAETIKAMKGKDILPLGRDGVDTGQWAIVDYGALVVHVFLPETREHYDLEMLWGDGTPVDWKEAEG